MSSKPDSASDAVRWLARTVGGEVAVLVRHDELFAGGLLITDEEMNQLAAAMGDSGRGVMEITIGGTRPDRVAEVDRFVELAHAARRPITPVSLRHNPERAWEHRVILSRLEALNRDGLRIYPQVTCSPLTSTFDLYGAFVFYRFPVWKRVLEAPPSEWRAVLADPGFRAEFRATAGRSSLFVGDTSPLRVEGVHRAEHARFSGPASRWPS